MLPGWSDEAIMECDLGRLQIALEAARKRIEADTRQRYRIAGHDVPEPFDGDMDDESFNAQIRETIRAMKVRAEHRD